MDRSSLTRSAYFQLFASPTDCTRTNVVTGSVSSVFHLVINRNMLDHIKSFTSLEVCRVLRNDWTISITDLHAFIAILYARGAYETKSLKACYLWSKKFGPAFFSITMLKDQFMQILRFIRLNNRTEGFERLRTNKIDYTIRGINVTLYNAECYKFYINIYLVISFISFMYVIFKSSYFEYLTFIYHKCIIRSHIIVNDISS